MSYEHACEQTALPERAADETDAGWGEPPEQDDDERLMREKPPHY